METQLCKAKMTNSDEWLEGYLYKMYEKEDFCLVAKDSAGITYTMIDNSTICRCTGKEYMDSEPAWEGDVFESQLSGHLMILRYGTYQAYCPVDHQYMDSVGFYAECEGLPDMPIGDLKEYALKRGNIFDNPELLQTITLQREDSVSILKINYEEKIERILGNKLEYNGNHTEAIADVKTWLCCEWQCGAIEDMSEYARLKDKVDDIAARMIKDL